MTENDRPQPSANFELVTPAMARAWLGLNENNRPIRTSHTEALTRNMLDGAFLQTGESIKFDWNGILFDGQHRLTSIVVSDKPAELLIVRNLPPAAKDVVDSGVKRTAGDALAMRGTKNHHAVAAGATLALKYPEVGFVDVGLASPTHPEIIKFVDDHPEIHRAAEVALSYYPQFDCKPSVQIVAWMRCAPIDTFAAGEFWSSIANQQTSGSGDPRLTLSRRLANARRSQEKLNQVQELSLLLRAWNAWRRGKKLNNLAISSSHGDVRVPQHLY